MEKVFQLAEIVWSCKKCTFLGNDETKKGIYLT